MAADCQITSIADKCTPAQELSSIPEGRVGQVCKEWLIREDGNLAYRLQNEEISHHYNENRSKNRTVREDIPLAKHLQENELYHAQRTRVNYERGTNDQAQNDEKVARQIQRRIWLEEEMAKRNTEEADERFALKLLQKEKERQLRKRLEKEKQQVERLSAQLGPDYGLNLESSSPSEEILPPPTPPTYQRILTEDEQELDLSEFCMPPPPGLTPEELKYFLEDQDAEIARLLQRQELKRNKNPKKEKLDLIEAQDYELARMLQKMEKDRVRRIKERLRARHSLTQSQRDAESGSSFTIAPLDNFQRTSTPISPQNSFEETQLREENEYDIPENHLLGLHGADNESTTYEEPYQVLCQQTDAHRQQQQAFHNIAIDLDPTYQRRLHSNLVESCVDDEEEPSSSVVQPNAFAKSNESSLERAPPPRRSSSETSDHHPSTSRPVTSTTSSRSSHASSSSAHSTDHRSEKSNRSGHGGDSQRNHPFGDIHMDHEEYAPPLPPRHVSLLSRNKTDLAAEPRHASPHANILPPHHPQHPNRRNMDPAAAQQSSQSPNRSSVYSNSNVIIQGHRRISSIEKPNKKDKHKSQDGCRTQ